MICQNLVTSCWQTSSGQLKHWWEITTKQLNHNNTATIIITHQQQYTVHATLTTTTTITNKYYNHNNHNPDLHNKQHTTPYYKKDQINILMLTIHTVFQIFSCCCCCCCLRIKCLRKNWLLLFLTTGHKNVNQQLTTLTLPGGVFGYSNF